MINKELDAIRNFIFQYSLRTGKRPHKVVFSKKVFFAVYKVLIDETRMVYPLGEKIDTSIPQPFTYDAVIFSYDERVQDDIAIVSTVMSFETNEVQIDEIYRTLILKTDEEEAEMNWVPGGTIKITGTYLVRNQGHYAVFYYFAGEETELDRVLLKKGAVK